MSRQESTMVLHLPTRFKFQGSAVTGSGLQINKLTKKNTEDNKDKEEDPSAAVIPTLAGIAEALPKISNIGHRIDITA
jgi:hypothetical protein